MFACIEMIKSGVCANPGYKAANGTHFTDMIFNGSHTMLYMSLHKNFTSTFFPKRFIGLITSALVR